MNIPFYQPSLDNVPMRRKWPRGRHSRRASALLIVLVLLSIMAVLVVSNSVRLSQLKRELQLIDQRQKQKFQEPIDHTNAVRRPSG